ncbi:uncharacterized protein LOC125563127 [Nematostella vectensis]|uniref:uncharacterized protein LOC125563127 n=1 Tax=Nematostella vectensis TaxID=45351 RepID=UPI002077484D|nr:uncharacterized protein LOC125563127 [Nematostella vectensis]
MICPTIMRGQVCCILGVFLLIAGHLTKADNPYCSINCSQALGMEDGRIADSAITASSSFSPACNASRSRLHAKKELQGSQEVCGGWVAANNSLDGPHWLKVDLGRLTSVTEIAIQGRDDSTNPQWTMTFTVSHSRDGHQWTDHVQQQSNVLTGNNDTMTVVSHNILPVLVTRYVRVTIKTFHGWPVLRVELYGCACGEYFKCPRPLGMESGDIIDSAITASSSLPSAWYYLPFNARLNRTPVHSVWLANSNYNQWLQIDLSSVTIVTSVSTQGRDNNDQWVKNYTLSYSYSEEHWTTYAINGIHKIFDGNTDRATIVTHNLLPAIEARFVRFQPKAFNGRIAMRTELYGYRCDGDKEYSLSFSGKRSTDYVLFPKVKAHQVMTVCSFVKSHVVQARQGLWTMFGSQTNMSFLLANGTACEVYLNDKKLDISTPIPIIQDNRWSHICFTWSNATGAWKFFLNGKKASEGASYQQGVHNGLDLTLMVGQRPGNDGLPLPQYSFSGQLAQFYLNHHFLADDGVWSLASGCSRDPGVIPWSIAHSWTHGDVLKSPKVFCHRHKVKHTWKVASNGSGKIEDVSYSVVQVVKTENVTTDLHSIDTDKQGYATLRTHTECISLSSLCYGGGITMSFWLRYRELFHSRILENKPEMTTQLNRLLSPIMIPNSKWSLCYRASEHGRDSAQHKSLCQKASVTLTIVRVKTYVFGGLLDSPWEAYDDDKAIEGVDAFLFSLANARGCPPFKLSIRNDSYSQAGRHVNTSGPVFGLNDLHLGPVSFSDLGLAYNLSELSCDHLALPLSREDARNLLAGTFYFTPDEIEVFTYRSKITSKGSFIHPSMPTATYVNIETSSIARLEFSSINCLHGHQIKTFHFQYSADGITWKTYPDDNKKKVFRYTGTPNSYRLLTPIHSARIIKVAPLTCYPDMTKCCLNYEVFVTDGTLGDSHIVASTTPASNVKGFRFYYSSSVSQPPVYIIEMKAYNNIKGIWRLRIPADAISSNHWSLVIITWSGEGLSVLINGNVIYDDFTR